MMNVQCDNGAKSLGLALTVLVASSLVLHGCADATSSAEKSNKPSTITLEQIQMAAPLSGGIFDSGYTLTRTLRDYPPDGDDNVFGRITNLADAYDHIDDDRFVLTVYGFARDDHPYIESFTLRVPADAPGRYTYDPETDTREFPEDTWLTLKTNYDVWFTAGEEWQYDSSLSVTITEVSDRWIEGSFTADLIYFNIEELDVGGIQKTIDEEISFTRQPILNGTFRVYRSHH